MACKCNDNASIRACPPYANVDDVNELLAAICPECVATVPSGTASSEFCSVGFGGAKNDCCELQIVFEGERIWFSTDCSNWYQSGCDTCWYEVAEGTAQNLWCGIAEANGIDTDCCKPMFFKEGSAIYITSDCVTFTQVSTPTLAILDYATVTGSSGALFINDDTWRPFTVIPAQSITMEEDGYIIGDFAVQAWYNGNCATSVRLYNNTTATWMDDGHVPILSNISRSVSFSLQQVIAGTYEIQPYYMISTACDNERIYGYALRLFTQYGS